MLGKIKKINLSDILGVSLAILPFSIKLNVWVLFSFFFLWILRIKRDNLLNTLHSKSFFYFTLFYGISVLAIFWSCNWTTGIFILEKRASLLLFPLTILSLREYRFDVYNIFNYFILGTSIAFVYCFCFAHYQWFVTGDEWYPFKYFNFTKNAIGIHPGYLSFYLLICLIYEFERLYKKSYIFSRNINIILIISKSLAILYIGTKSAFFILVILLLVFLIQEKKKKRHFITYIVGFLIILTATCFVYYHISYGFRTRVAFMITGRFNNNQIRLDIIKAVVLIFKEQPFKLFFGFGTGCFIDELMLAYEKLGLLKHLNEKLDVHNIYLKAISGQGLLGFGSLLFMFQGLKLKYIKQDLSYFLFSVTFALFGIIEHFIELQHGIVIFACLNILFYSRTRD